MSLTAWSLVGLLFVVLSLLFLVQFLVKQLLRTVLRTLNDQRDLSQQVMHSLIPSFQTMVSMFNNSLSEQTRQLSKSHHEILGQSFSTQRHQTGQLVQSQRELFQNLITPVMKHQEILVNRLLSKDAIAVQALDARNLSETAMSSDHSDRPHIPTDHVEAQQYYGSPEELINEEDFRQDQEESGLFNMNP